LNKKYPRISPYSYDISLDIPLDRHGYIFEFFLGIIFDFTLGRLYSEHNKKIQPCNILEFFFKAEWKFEYNLSLLSKKFSIWVVQSSPVA